MKKVGIFTIYIANYGAVLQTYALQRYLRDTYPSLDVTVVDFYSNEPYAIFKKASNNPLKNLLRQGTKLFHYSSLKRRNKRERCFINEEFKLSERFENLRDLYNNMPDYDIYLTGSDQVFNLQSKYSDLFYQKFQTHGGIKAAYAPSFGTSDFSEDYKNKIQIPVRSFNYLSCREDDGATMLTEVVGKRVPRVLDPTLLLNKEQWSKMMICPKRNEKFLLVYDLNGGQRLIDIAKPIAKQNNWKIWCITQHTDVRYSDVDNLIFDAGPREFVGLFSQSQYVVTDSFHGTAFSIIFEKDFKTFIAIPRASRRIVSLLAECGMTGHIIADKEENNKSHKFPSSSDMTTFFQLKRRSQDFLNDIVTA